MSTDVRVVDLHLAYHAKIALDGISLDFPQGRLTSIVGPSGCGKTSLLRSIAGFLHPSAGRVFFGERDVTAQTPQKRRAGMVFQQYALWPHMSVFENVGYGLRLLGDDRATTREKVMDILERVEIDTAGVTKRHPQSYSGGQQQRIALARALVTKPDVLLLDEPLSNLDEKVRARLRIEIRKIQQDFGITAIYVTHDQEEALSMSDQVVIMDAGVVQQAGTPEHVYESPRSLFVAEFLGDGNTIRMRSPERSETIVIRTGDVRIAAAAPGALPTADWVRASDGSLSGVGALRDTLYFGGRFRHLVDVNRQEIIVDSETRLDAPVLEVRLPAAALKRFDG